MTSEIFRTLETFDTEFSADSVEWCPICPFTDIFACGTYQLANDEVVGDAEKPKATIRLGRIYLFRVSDGKLKLLHQLDVPAVLDIKWMHVKLDQKILLGVVNAKGYLQIYELTDENSISLVLLTEKRITEDENDALALSLDWSSGKCDSNQQDVKIVVSDSKGCIHTFKYQSKHLEHELGWTAHGHEAWIAAFDYWNTNVIFTGGDDCKLQWFDVRVGTSPAGINRIHGAGVTSLHSNAGQEFQLASGSYDEILRLWDVRKMRNPVSELNMDGGLWRLKWEPKGHKYLLAACMYGGFKIVDCVKNGTCNIVGQYMEHGSISYGCDWSLLNSRDLDCPKTDDSDLGTGLLIATCSFYDHTLKLAVVDLTATKPVDD